MGCSSSSLSSENASSLSMIRDRINIPAPSVTYIVELQYNFNYSE